MPYSEIEAKFLGPGEELTSEPCYKKLKSAAEAYVFPHHGGLDSHRIQEKTGNKLVSVTALDVRGRSCPQADKSRTADLLKPLHNEKPGNRLDVTESTNSQILPGGNPELVSKDDDIYSTSKAFIGPIYKPPEKKKRNERKNEKGTLNYTNDKGRREEKQKFNSKKSEIDTELSQFYKEIEELENGKDDSQDSCKESEPSQEQINPYYQGHNNDTLKPSENKDLSNVLQSHFDYQHYLENEPSRYPCDEQVIPTFCDISFTSFRPEWQSAHPFIVPYGPPLPSFNCHLNIQRFNAPLNPQPNIFHTPDDSQMPNGCYVSSFQDNWNCLTLDQNNEYTNYSENNSRVHPSRYAYSVQDGYMSNGFCEIREGYWKDPMERNGTHRFVNQQFQEEKLNKLQKLLILLRGLPGSGKTTLSRILLGQSRDGIVFSTDDYFYHQDGYRYNVNQLGDAHDWNQNRAKQAIDQGRSPVIIDNTNTQAWEMKPYVEMAIGKGYRVEFHEPETWWKFDPEELEKRNKHGVSRKKIAQMLDRYEFQMSISIVMNSVEPPQKSIQRPLPLQGSQRERFLKKTRCRLNKNKQKRKRKRNTEHNSLSENSFDQTPSQSKEGFEETKRESEYPFSVALQSEVVDSVNDCKEESQNNTDPADTFQYVMLTAELDSIPKNCFPKEEDDLTQHCCHVTSTNCSGMKMDKPVGSRLNLIVDIQNILAETPRWFMRKVETDKGLPNKPVLCHQQEFGTSKTVVSEEQEVHATESSCWPFFTTSLSTEELQLGSEHQLYFVSWPEGPHKLVCEQRPKKDRSHRLTSPNSKERLIEFIPTSEEASRSASPEILIEEKLLTEKVLPPPTETIDPLRNPETNVLSCLPLVDISNCALESSKNKQRMQNEIFNLPPDLNIPGQTHINTKERENQKLNVILEKKDRISKIISEEKKKQKVITFDHPPPLFCLDITNDSSLTIGQQLHSHYLSFNRLGHVVYFYKNPVPSFVPHYISSFCMVSFNIKKSFLTLKAQRRTGKKLIDTRFISSEILSHQLDTLYSLKVSSDTQFLDERIDEKLKI